jgi:mannose-6-phosphate isomerase
LTVPTPVLSRIEPIFSPRLWGARSLAPFFPNKTNLAERLGEAWLTSTDSRIANGPFAGKSLGESWRAMPSAWRGTALDSYPEFPILVKFLFPNDKLSIQVHPDDSYAEKHEQAAGGRGKTEMWHIVSSQPGAEILFGLKPGVTREHFLAGIERGTLEDLLAHQPVQAGDTYFVSPGTQHALGAGIVVCEIQEYSDLTYRVYDFNRVDASGKPRELHIEKAMEVTRYGGPPPGKLAPMALHSPDAKKYLLAACPYFATERWDCCKTTLIESDPQHFQLLIILEGHGKFYDTDNVFDYRLGETWFLPASLPAMGLQPEKLTSLLRVFVPSVESYRRQLQNQGFDESSMSRVLFGIG